MIPDSILVDCCVLADLFIGKKEFEDNAADLRRNFPTWYSASLIKTEFGNVLKTQIRAGKMTEKKAQEVLSKAIGMLVICEEPSGAVILKEAIVSGLTFYDATYVATARSLGLVLCTRDAEILKNCPDVARSLADNK